MTDLYTEEALLNHPQPWAWSAPRYPEAQRPRIGDLLYDEGRERLNRVAGYRLMMRPGRSAGLAFLVQGPAGEHLVQQQQLAYVPAGYSDPDDLPERGVMWAYDSYQQE